MSSTTFDPDRPLTLLPTNEASDFSRNFREMQKHAKRPYSLTRVLRSFCTSPPKRGTTALPLRCLSLRLAGTNAIHAEHLTLENYQFAFDTKAEVLSTETKQIPSASGAYPIRHPS
jgi:hypothetical protein